MSLITAVAIAEVFALSILFIHGSLSFTSMRCKAIPTFISPVLISQAFTHRLKYESVRLATFSFIPELDILLPKGSYVTTDTQSCRFFQESYIMGDEIKLWIDGSS